MKALIRTITYPTDVYILGEWFNYHINSTPGKSIYCYDDYCGVDIYSPRRSHFSLSTDGGVTIVTEEELREALKLRDEDKYDFDADGVDLDGVILKDFVGDIYVDLFLSNNLSEGYLCENPNLDDLLYCQYEIEGDDHSSGDFDLCVLLPDETRLELIASIPRKLKQLIELWQLNEKENS